jgi:hypothetical protein
MAKEDFCFTYYDGDAARDTTHMNRLERGAYHDVVISQRKFGHLTIEQVKKILGKDFIDCWPAIELIMKIDTEGKFFIEWLDTSIIKSRKHSKKQTENVTKRYQTSTKHLPKEEMVTPLGDGNEDGNDNEVVIEFKEKESKKIESPEVEILETDIPVSDHSELVAVYSPLFREGLLSAFRDVDVDDQWIKFQAKVRGSPKFYALHDLEGLRLAFNRHLQNAPKKNERTPKTKHERQQSELHAGFAKRRGNNSGIDPCE